MSTKTNQTTLGEFLGTAFLSYIVTSIDDLVVLLNFFTEATLPNSPIKTHHVFIGQYIGFLILLAVSLIGYALSFAMPVQILGFLGFLPIILGIKGIVQIIIEEWRKRHKKVDDTLPNDDISKPELESSPSQNDINGLTLKESTNDEEKQKLIVDSSSKNTCKEKFLKLLHYSLNLQTLKVVSVTLADSADNAAIYISLFAQATTWEIVLYIAIFLGMVTLCLICCYFFIHFRPVLYVAQKCARYIVPIAFIGIGIYIIITSDCFPWLVRAIRTNNFSYG